jgi:hypothetical protein
MSVSPKLILRDQEKVNKLNLPDSSVAEDEFVLPASSVVEAESCFYLNLICVIVILLIIILLLAQQLYLVKRE